MRARSELDVLFVLTVHRVLSDPSPLGRAIARYLVECRFLPLVHRLGNQLRNKLLEDLVRGPVGEDPAASVLRGVMSLEAHV